MGFTMSNESVVSAPLEICSSFNVLRVHLGSYFGTDRRNFLANSFLFRLDVINSIRKIGLEIIEDCV